ncbi:MAG: hypothetical protein AB7G62_01045 [Magnetospirillum sp.]
MDSNKSDNEDPFAQIVNMFLATLRTVVTVIIIFGIIVILLIIYDGINPGHGQASAITASKDIINAVIGLAKDIWSTISPILQLAAVMFIVWWFFKKSGISLTDIGSSSETQKILAITVISSLCLAAFVNTEAANILKDIALVVVGFYFGSKQTDNTSNTPLSSNRETDNK